MRFCLAILRDFSDRKAYFSQLLIEYSFRQVERMKCRERIVLHRWWLVMGLMPAGLVAIQVSETAPSFIGTVDANSSVIGQPVTDLPTIDPLRDQPRLPHPQILSEITQRSLFRETRGVQTSEISTSVFTRSETKSEATPEVKLIGTLLSRRADVALVTEEQAVPRRLRIGDRVNDWEIVRIQRDNVVFRQDDSLAPVTLR